MFLWLALLGAFAGRDLCSPACHLSGFLDEPVVAGTYGCGVNGEDQRGRRRAASRSCTEADSAEVVGGREGADRAGGGADGGDGERDRPSTRCAYEHGDEMACAASSWRARHARVGERRVDHGGGRTLEEGAASLLIGGEEGGATRTLVLRRSGRRVCPAFPRSRCV